MKCFRFDIGLENNKESNDFLRCLWSRMAVNFGKLAWQYVPFKVPRSRFIQVGRASVGDDTLIDVRIIYKNRGCLSSIVFDLSGQFDTKIIKERLNQSITEAFRDKDYIHEVIGKGTFDNNIEFKGKKGRLFAVENNEYKIHFWGYDKADCSSMFKTQSQQICDLLTFDTLKYITITGTLTELIRNHNNLRTQLVNNETGKSIGGYERNIRFRNLVVSDSMVEYIDDYLERPYQYENHFTNFDRSVQLFSQGIRNEELSNLCIGFPEPYVEQAVVFYMSALEVITLDDGQPEKCECCGQMKYSIARRVTDLMNVMIPGGGEFAKQYYKARSKYVHTGILLSSNNYQNRSIPLMSMYSDSGMIDQIPQVNYCLKEIVKLCIERHG